MIKLLSPRLKAQIVKEFLIILRDKKTRIMLLIPPLMQRLIFGFAATLEVRNINIGILNHVGGIHSRELASRIASASFVQNALHVKDEKELRRLVDTQKVIGVVKIGEDFSKNIALEKPATIELIIDGVRTNAGQITQGYLNAIILQYQAELKGKNAPNIAQIRHWFNPNLIYQWFVVPNLAGTLTMFLATLITALSIARERELGTFDQLLVSPCTPFEIIVAKAAPGVAIGMFLYAMMLSAAIFLFKVPFLGSLTLLSLCALLFNLCIVSIGLMISSICNTQQQAILGTFGIAAPMILISGFATPVENMPLFLQYIAEAMPLKHFLIIIAGSFTKAMPPYELLQNALPMALIAIVALSSATLLVRSKLQ